MFIRAGMAPPKLVVVSSKEVYRGVVRVGGSPKNSALHLFSCAEIQCANSSGPQLAHSRSVFFFATRQRDCQDARWSANNATPSQEPVQIADEHAHNEQPSHGDRICEVENSGQTTQVRRVCPADSGGSELQSDIQNQIVQDKNNDQSRSDHSQSQLHSDHCDATQQRPAVSPSSEYYPRHAEASEKSRPGSSPGQVAH